METGPEVVRPVNAQSVPGRHMKALAVAASVFVIAACAPADRSTFPVPQTRTSGSRVAPVADAIGADGARYLLRRATFEPSPAEIARFQSFSREAAVDALVGGVRGEAVTPLPTWIALPLPTPAELRNLDDAGRRALREQNVRRAAEARAWWVAEMLATPSPLTERMTLFWHNHFVSSQQKVRASALMLRQNALFRAHALGDFGALLAAVAKDPAMLVYLDGATSRKDRPNENFAREVMELFTLGEGAYTEYDVREAARAFTGWSLDRETRAFVFRRALHDDGVKTVLGRTGRFDGDDVIAMLAADPRASRWIVGKLWREFVSPVPDAAEVDRIAGRMLGAGQSTRVALRELLLTDAFWAAEARHALVKSPVELVVGTARQLGANQVEPEVLAAACARLGQTLFAPPNVKGWPGGEAWITGTTLPARQQFLRRAADRAGRSSADRTAVATVLLEPSYQLK